MKRIAAVVALLGAIGASAVLAQTQGAGGQQRFDPEQLFRRLDRNGDGKLTADEVPNPQILKALDRDGDGVVTREEAAAFGGRAGQGARQWRDTRRSEGAPLPPAEGFKARAHGEEASAAGLKPGVLAKLDIEMQRHVAAKNVSGVVALTDHDGKQGYFEAFGQMDIEAAKPMARDAIFRLMSMTKPLIAATALVLLDEGMFTLDEPIAKHCPEWASPTVLEDGKRVPAKTPITPRMLMSHSSGLYYGTLADAGGAAEAAVPFRAMSGRGTSLKEFSESLASRPLKFQPGTDWNYGTSIDVLGRYIEAVTGKPLDVVVRAKLTGPLKMVDTDFWVKPDKASRLCQVYRQPQPGVLQPGRQAAPATEKPSLFMGGHGMCSTASDYARFCRMILNRGELDGVRVLKPETVDLMFQNHVKGGGRQYGLGGVVNGDGTYGWGGAFGTQFWVDRTNTLFAVFMVQTQDYKAPAYPVFQSLVLEAAGQAGRARAGGVQAGASGAFRQRDKNGDGKLGPDEIPAALLQRLDADKDGFVTEEELRALWATGGQRRLRP